MAETYDVALLTWSPLAGGALTGRYPAGAAAPVGSRFATLWKGQERELGPAAHRAIGRLAALARERGVPLAVLGQAWVLQRGEVTRQYGADGFAWVPWGPHRRRWR